VGSRLPGGLTGVLRLFGSRGACRRHRSCALGVSKRFGAVSGHLPVARSVFFGNPQSLFNLVHGIAVDGRAVAHEPPQCWGYSCTAWGQHRGTAVMGYLLSYNRAELAWSWWFETKSEVNVDMKLSTWSHDFRI
jgi:hypothetical protein